MKEGESRRVSNRNKRRAVGAVSAVLFVGGAYDGFVNTLRKVEKATAISTQTTPVEAELDLVNKKLTLRRNQVGDAASKGDYASVQQLTTPEKVQEDEVAKARLSELSQEKKEEDASIDRIKPPLWRKLADLGALAVGAVGIAGFMGTNRKPNRSRYKNLRDIVADRLA